MGRKVVSINEAKGIRQTLAACKPDSDEVVILVRIDKDGNAGIHFSDTTCSRLAFAAAAIDTFVKNKLFGNFGEDD